MMTDWVWRNEGRGPAFIVEEFTMSHRLLVLLSIGVVLSAGCGRELAPAPNAKQPEAKDDSLLEKISRSDEKETHKVNHHVVAAEKLAQAQAAIDHWHATDGPTHREEAGRLVKEVLALEAELRSEDGAQLVERARSLLHDLETSPRAIWEGRRAEFLKNLPAFREKQALYQNRKGLKVGFYPGEIPIRGKLLITVRAWYDDAGDRLGPFFYPEPGCCKLGLEKQFGHLLATRPEEVGTVMQLDFFRTEIGKYDNGRKAYKHFGSIHVIDLVGKEEVGGKFCQADDPMVIGYGSPLGDAEVHRQMFEFLRQLKVSGEKQK